MAVRVESLSNGQLLYQRNSDKLVMPASNMKLVTMAVAAERLGWDYRFETDLDAYGDIRDSVLHGDLVVRGRGDPTIGSPDLTPPALFSDWAEALTRAGIHQVEGRLIADARWFDRNGLGTGWAWDNLNASYSAPSSALSYDENTVTIIVTPGKTADDPVSVAATAGQPYRLVNEMRAGTAGSSTVTIEHALGSRDVVVRGFVAPGGKPVTRTIAADDPPLFFIGAMREALAARGITVSGGLWNIEKVSHIGEEVLIDIAGSPLIEYAKSHKIDHHWSRPLSVIAGYFMKVSQNFYAETLLKALDIPAMTGVGTSATIRGGRAEVMKTLGTWGIPAGSVVMDDGSGLSRYDYVTADAIVAILKHMWNDEKLRGPFTALLPVAGHDGTLDTRMRSTVLDAKVEAKTGTIANVRSLSGYLETRSGERIVFSMIANNFTATSAAVDAVVEKALARIAER